MYHVETAVKYRVAKSGGRVSDNVGSGEEDRVSSINDNKNTIV